MLNTLSPKRVKSASRIAATSLMALSIGLPAMAECSRSSAPDRYELVELPTPRADSDRAEAVAIRDDGTILLRAFPNAADTYVYNYLLSDNDDAAVPSDISNTFGVGMIDITALHQNGYQSGNHYSLTPTNPATTVTQIIQDGQGGGLPMRDYCPTPEGSDLTLAHVELSRNGAHAFGLFTGGSRYGIATCDEAGSTMLSESDGFMTLEGVSDGGMAAGNIFRTGKTQVWVAYEDNPAAYPFGADTSTTWLLDMNPAGDLFVSQLDAVKNRTLIWSPGKGETREIELLEGDGWSAKSGILGPCGEIIGDATQTAYEEFSKLSEAERTRIRSYTDLIGDWDSRRTDDMFLWTPKGGAKPFFDQLSAELGWNNIDILDINADGVAVGRAIDPEGVQRAIKLVPIR